MSMRGQTDDKIKELLAEAASHGELAAVDVELDADGREEVRIRWYNKAGASTLSGRSLRYEHDEPTSSVIEEFRKTMRDRREDSGA